jgi:hypothetical protein
MGVITQLTYLLVWGTDLVDRARVPLERPMSRPQKFRFRPPTGQGQVAGTGRGGRGEGSRRAEMGRGLGLTRRGGRFVLFFGAPGLLPGCPGAGKMFRAPGAVPGPGTDAGQSRH